MCPKFKQGICEIAGIEPEHVECVDRNCCFSSKWEMCKLFIVELLISNKRIFPNSHWRREVA